MWGVGTSAYQIEGAAFEDGKGLSIWDVFASDGKCFNRQTGEIACDHYHRFHEDIKLMRELGVKEYRFSVSWPRILPDGIGEVNQFGIDFYNRLIDLLLENGMACHDIISCDGKVHDPNRIEFMRQYLNELNDAINDGVDIDGYMYWSFMDNFEWTHGYSQRFGLVYVNYNDLSRIPKDSFYWYQKVVRNNEIVS